MVVVGAQGGLLDLQRDLTTKESLKGTLATLILIVIQ